VVAVVLASSGGGGEDPGASATGEAATTGTTQTTEGPKTLSTSQLVKRADKSCEAAKAEYLEARDEFSNPESEAGMSVEFAERLVGISGRQVSALEKLVPPPSKEDEFEEYLESRKEVAELDKAALRAAKADEPRRYVDSYELRDTSEAEREALADEIGFEVCSQPKS
jgi:hypothetical protein